MDTSATTKLVTKLKGKNPIQPTQLELKIGKILFDLQNSGNELATEIHPLCIYAASEIELANGHQALLISVPTTQIGAWRKVQVRLARELEKKLATIEGQKNVVIVGHRQALSKTAYARSPAAKKQKIRPRSKTLAFVHDAWLEDLVYPTEIVGKRIRVKTDGESIIKVFLDFKDQTVLESRLDTLAGVYQKLTGKNVVFDFPSGN